MKMIMRYVYFVKHGALLFDADNLDTLDELENAVKLWEKIIEINPDIKPFVRGKNCCGSSNKFRYYQ